jgi:hypothetical protein
MHYLKLPWSHGQPDLVNIGLPAAFEFVDQALARGDGVLIQWVVHYSNPHLIFDCPAVVNVASLDLEL